MYSTPPNPTYIFSLLDEINQLENIKSIMFIAFLSVTLILKTPP
jgi:hypothetical protein